MMARASAQRIQTLVPTYRQPDTLTSLRPSGQARYRAYARIQTQENHINLIGTGAFRGQSVRGEGGFRTTVGRIQEVFSGTRYDGQVRNGFHFTSRSNGGDAQARRDASLTGIPLTAQSNNPGVLQGSTTLGNGTIIQVQLRQGGLSGQSSYPRLEVRITTPPTQDAPRVQSVFQIRYSIRL